MSAASPARSPFGLALFALAALALAGCSSGGGGTPKKRIKTGSVSIATVSLMKQNDMPRTAPIMMRVFKAEGVLEVWKQERNGRYGLLRSYPICRFSGGLGPKRREGDRQAPEGFYAITAKSLNPYSRNHLAFDVGFPNVFDRSLGRSGSHLMVHGGCKSVGCYAMTHKRMEEIYGLAREALANGQRAIPFQAFPFRMTAENMRERADDPNYGFWTMLKEGHDLFATTGSPPYVAACPGRYVFSSAARGPVPADACLDEPSAEPAPALVQAEAEAARLESAYRDMPQSYDDTGAEAEPRPDGEE